MRLASVWTCCILEMMRRHVLHDLGEAVAAAQVAYFWFMEPDTKGRNTGG